MIQNNILADKSFAFALRCVRLYNYLKDEKNEYTLSKQMLRSGTSIGANIKEGIYAQSRPDFGTKLTIAKKEAAETEYWLELLTKSGYLSVQQSESMLTDCRELLKMLISITKKIFQPESDK